MKPLTLTLLLLGTAAGLLFFVTFAPEVAPYLALIWGSALTAHVIRHRKKAGPYGRWVVRRTIWPYADGWGTYRPSTNTLLDSGLSRDEAERRCNLLNAGTP